MRKAKPSRQRRDSTSHRVRGIPLPSPRHRGVSVFHSVRVLSLLEAEKACVRLRATGALTFEVREDSSWRRENRAREGFQANSLSYSVRIRADFSNPNIRDSLVAINL